MQIISPMCFAHKQFGLFIKEILNQLLRRMQLYAYFMYSIMEFEYAFKVVVVVAKTKMCAKARYILSRFAYFTIQTE